MVKLYALNHEPSYYYTPVYFTTDKEKAEKLKKEFNERHHNEHWQMYENTKVRPSIPWENCGCQKYSIVEEELDGPIDHLSEEYPQKELNRS